MKAARYALGLLAVLVLVRPARSQEPGRIPLVAAAAVTREDIAKEITLQAEFRPYEEVELHAKVSGYLQKIDVDFGDRVKAGDLIATIEVPELQDEKEQAAATAQRAEADYAEAHLEDTRLAGVNRSQPNLISQQELDTSAVKERTAAAAAAAAKADADKYTTLMSYTRITAPFDGVVTARYVDAGALIQTGSSASGPLIRLSENQRLRLDFPVSVTYAADIAVGDPVAIRLEGSAQPLEAKITRFSHRIDMATRTMETEVVVPNPELKLIPGMYATVTLHVQRRAGALTVPLEAISSTEHPTVYLLGPQGRIEERAVTLGVETPSRYEVLAGVAEGDLVLVGSRASVQPGEQVQPKLLAPGLRAMNPLPAAAEIEALRRLDGCALANAIEPFHSRLRNEGFMNASVRCVFPRLRAMVGHAVTLKVRGASPPTGGGSAYGDRTDWWDYVLSVPAPRVVVVEDVGSQLGLGALLGEVHVAILRRLGCVGAVTNGSVRDLPAVEEMEFPFFAGGLSVSHSYVHIVETGGPVMVGGLPVRSGDLLHGDRHGVQSVPAGLVGQIPAMAAKLAARDRDLVALCRAEDFSLDKLRSALASLR